MKKPKITEGEWKYGVDGGGGGVIVVSVPSNDIIANTKGKDRGFNAKAISAVPEMIDALIVAHEQLIQAKNYESSIVDRRAINDVEQALIKAGCQ